MREYTHQPEQQSRALDSNSRASKQAPTADISQAYKERTFGRPVQRTSVDDAGLLQAKTASQASIHDILQRYKATTQRYALNEESDVQQKQGCVPPTMQLQGMNVNNNEVLEKEADVKAMWLKTKKRQKRDNNKLNNAEIANSSRILQGRFYFGNRILSKEELNSKLSMDENPDLLDIIWAVYGKKDDTHMEMRSFNKVLSKQKNPIDNYLFIKALKAIPQNDIDTPLNFKKRIEADTRLAAETRNAYIEAFNKRVEDNAKYERVKGLVKQERQRWRDANKGKADNELREGIYFTQTQKDDFRTLEIDSKLGGANQLLLKKVEKRVLGMKDKLTAAWYYNQANEAEIFKDHELRSYKEREKLAGVKVDSKSMSVDVDNNKTGGYFYSFIEHEDSYFNTNTRFIGKATPNGALGGSDGKGRRLRIPLKKMVKSGAMIMGGDLASDHQERDKMGLTQNKTPTKLFGSGKSKEDIDKQIEGLLRNYVNFVGRRIYEALPYTLTRLLLSCRLPTKGELAIQKLTKEMDTMSDQALWEYLVREIAQPQLMTPMKVATSMKGLKIDEEPPLPLDLGSLFV